jgi:hypothetical protein
VNYRRKLLNKEKPKVQQIAAEPVHGDQNDSSGNLDYTPNNAVAVTTVDDSSHAHRSKKQPQQPLSVIEQGREYLRHVLPSVYESSRSMLSRLALQLFMHHPILRLINVVTGNNRKGHSPFLILGEILTEFMFAAFVLALMFDLQYPSDDGTCVLYSDATSCTARSSVLDASRSYCLWAMQPRRTFSLSVGLFLQQSISVLPSGQRELSVRDMEPLILPPESVRYACVYNAASPSFTASLMVYLFTSVVSQLVEIPVHFLFELTVRASEAQVNARKATAMINSQDAASTNISPVMTASSTKVGNHHRRSGIRMRQVVVLPLDKSGTEVRSAGTVQQEENVTSNKSKPGEHGAWLISRPSEQLQSLRRTLLQRYHVSLLTGNNNNHQIDEEIVQLVLQELLKNDRKNPQLTRVWNAARNTLEQADQAEDRRKNSTVKNLVTRLNRRRTVVPETAVIMSDDKKTELMLYHLRNKLKKEEKTLTENLRAASQAEVGLTLLHVFISDLLGRTTNRPAAQLFQQVVHREFQTNNSLEAPVKLWQRILAVVLLLAANVFAVYYTLLRGLKQGVGWQKIYLLVLMGQWLSDMLFVRVIQIAVMDCFVPLLISEEMRYVWAMLDGLWHHHHHHQQRQQQQHKRRHQPKPSQASLMRFLLLSRRCAESFSHVLEAQMIILFGSCLPIGLVDFRLLKHLKHRHHDHDPDHSVPDVSETTKKRYEKYSEATAHYFLGMLLKLPYSLQSGAIGSMSSLALTGLLFLWSVSSRSVWSAALLVVLPFLALAAAAQWMSKITPPVFPVMLHVDDDPDEDHDRRSPENSPKHNTAAESGSFSFSFSFTSSSESFRSSLTSSYGDEEKDSGNYLSDEEGSIPDIRSCLVNALREHLIATLSTEIVGIVNQSLCYHQESRIGEGYNDEWLQNDPSLSENKSEELVSGDSITLSIHDQEENHEDLDDDDASRDVKSRLSSSLDDSFMLEDDEQFFGQLHQPIQQHINNSSKAALTSSDFFFNNNSSDSFDNTSLPRMQSSDNHHIMMMSDSLDDSMFDSSDTNLMGDRIVDTNVAAVVIDDDNDDLYQLDESSSSSTLTLNDSLFVEAEEPADHF